MENRIKFNPSDLFEVLGVENKEDARKVFEATLSFLLHIEVGDEIKLPSASIKKISHDMLAINQSTSDQSTMVRLLHKRVIEVDI